MDTVKISSQHIPLAYECDICVIGGSCTGVFAAVSAAKLGAEAALVEQNGFFGGTATAGLVNVWHSIYDTAGKQQIIGGLTAEVIDRMKQKGTVNLYQVRSGIDHDKYAVFNSAELIMTLDRLVQEQKTVRPFLHSVFSEPVMENGSVKAVIIQDKSGRRAIRARYFIDASGDGDCIARADFSTRTEDHLQPATTCFILNGLDEVKRLNPDFSLNKAAFNPEYPHALKNGFLWSSECPGNPGSTMIAGTRVHDADCSDADEFTSAEIEGRRQAQAILDIIRDNFKGGDSVGLTALPSHIGIRETRHASCMHRLSENEVLEGKRFPDAIANGSYRVDIHHSGRPGLTFRYLDGREVHIEPGKPDENGRWRAGQSKDPTFYQIPYRSLVPKDVPNVLATGRLIDADAGAYGAVRVMVNCNQTGEAAGTAAYCALDSDAEVSKVDTNKLRDTMMQLGSIII